MSGHINILLQYSNYCDYDNASVCFLYPHAQIAVLFGGLYNQL